MSRSRHTSRQADAGPQAQAAHPTSTPRVDAAPLAHATVEETRATGIAGSTTPSDAVVPIGVGIDTSRYGHHASFLRADLQPAAGNLGFVESADGYQKFRQRLEAIAAKHAGRVHFHVRFDVAGHYADNLLSFLHELAAPAGQTRPARADAPGLVNASFTISCGDPQRNKNYRVAIFGAKKCDAVESAACARYALTEHPKPTPTCTSQMHILCHIASRLEAQARQGTRVTNQLHNLLARTFPELALLVSDISAGWVLSLLTRYPTPAKLAGARAGSLEKIPYLPHEHIPMLLEQARVSVASLTGPTAEELVRELVSQVKDTRARQKSLEKLLVQAYRQLPQPNHLDSIKGFGEVTAAVLTAKIVDPNRFVEPSKITGYFGTFPVETQSGIGRDGKPRGTKRMVMSKRGNDLVRRYLFMAALSAVLHNPAVRPLYQRLRAKHPDQPSIAIGHAMAKLLRLALAVWKSGKPFDPKHYPWEQPAHLGARGQAGNEAREVSDQGPETDEPTQSGDITVSQETQAAGHKVPEIVPERSVVTAACANTSVATPPPGCNAAPPAAPAHAPMSDIAMSQQPPPDQTARAGRSWIDFDHLKSQLPLVRVLEHLGLRDSLRGSRRQCRGPCPVHAKNERRKGRTFSAHLEQNVFQCFDPKCGIKGDVIDLWAALKGLKLRDAAVDLVRTFNLEPAPRTEKRNG